MHNNDFLRRKKKELIYTHSTCDNTMLMRKVVDCLLRFSNDDRLKAEE